MCGIVGAVAQRNVVPILLEGLRRLEYRGYDSAGLAVLDNGLKRLVSTGRVAELARRANETYFQGVTGIAHTRWATHGRPSDVNAHPHTSGERVAVVHNGIIENHEQLRKKLRGQGFEFVTETDTEVIAHLVHSFYEGDVLRAVQKSVAELHGAYAIAVLIADEPHRLIGARAGSPMVVGLGVEENFLASDASALTPVTQRVVYLEEGDVVDLGLMSYQLYDRQGKAVTRPVQTAIGGADMAELGNYRHYMQKEIFEQPRAITDTLHGLEAITPELFGEGAADILGNCNAVNILACGTSYHAGLVARYWIEALAGVPASVEIASEYRYRDSVPNPNALVVAISQSGETADTLAAVEHAKGLGHENVLAICNRGESALVRRSRLVYLTRAGAEIGVASTKAFTTQLTALHLLTLTLAKLRGRLAAEDERKAIEGLRHLPAAVSHVLALETQISAWAERFAEKHHALFLGRGMHYPIALEGALKLKEISYIHAEAYPAGELKHGPLALVDADMPVITVAPNDALLEKLKSNMQEVRARGGELYVFADAGSEITDSDGVHVIQLPDNMGALSPIVHVVPLQMLAYHAALQKGTDVDKPRNLAKSVTVE
ncbi:MAG: glutamine--fructose-6-phosphate transaminase (isomerizing) [Betaproteobacteria bacterium]|nr:glutamine--fructose-6-phosphate transaminase (isomerizing) [Betaproteobacteria bacterium]